MSEQGDQDFSVDDIINAPRTNEVVRRDLANELTLHNILVANGIADIRRLLKEVGVSVLKQLQALGIQDAEILVNDLDTVHPTSDLLMSDMDGLATGYRDYEEHAEDPEERERLRLRGELATAVSHIVAARMAQFLPEGADLRVSMLDSTEERIEMAGFPDNTYEALHSLVQEMRLPPEIH